MADRQNGDLASIRHSISHIMAEAVLQMFPEAKIAIGPAIENGFYYDFDLPRALKPEDLTDIEEKMKEIIKGNHDFVKKVISKEVALKLFKSQPFKVELINELPENEEISIYTQNSFTDLCRGPHVANTNELDPGSFKLLSIAGAYWRGDEKNKMLQRIYGTAWKTAKDLRTHLNWLAEVEKRDHRKLGKELDLFSLHEEAGAGLVYWHPKGARIRSTIEDFWRKEHFRDGYELLYTPHIGKSWLWEKSGHLGFYSENMYAPLNIDDQDYYIKPMNCPFHILIYKTAIRSYRDLPLRWAELGTVYRYERSGVLHGLLRVRGFTQDDAHIICTPDQIEDEIRNVLRFSLKIWDAFKFKDIKAYLATRPEGSVGEEARWEQATESLKKAIGKENLEYTIDEGGGAFYGPKIDLKVRDAIGREWQMSTIQFDFNEPERFDMKFMDNDGTEKRPYMVHRALFGSLERFFGVLIENYAGAFPVWIAPVQVMVIPVAHTLDEYAGNLRKQLLEQEIRVEADLSDNRMNAKIRTAQQQKIPYMLIVGEKEEKEGAVSVRTRTGEQKNMMKTEEFIEFIKGKIETKDLI
ncbi:MAG: threonine--tRNA ligase [Spirochaetales bacterium]|nr:threonine--tRNA ligase [Spirochaetales bacterium]